MKIIKISFELFGILYYPNESNSMNLVSFVDTILNKPLKDKTI
jgi:hypothetical protein